MTDYRYTLEREWVTGFGRVVWVMLNPSTADVHRDDPTIQKCIGFSSRWGAAGLVVVNLYAARATQPAALWKMDDPVGPRNDHVLRRTLAIAAEGCWTVVAAWGANARPDRIAVVTQLAGELGVRLETLGVTLAGRPRHPLYVPYSAGLIPWEPPK